MIVRDTTYIIHLTGFSVCSCVLAAIPYQPMQVHMSCESDYSAYEIDPSLSNVLYHIMWEDCLLPFSLNSPLVIRSN